MNQLSNIQNNKNIKKSKLSFDNFNLDTSLILENWSLKIILLLFILLTPTITKAATLSKSPNNLGLVGYWSMDEGDGTKVQDTSGFGNTGTLTSGTWIKGKKGNALSFNGTNKIDAGNSSSLQLTTGTVSAWVKTTDAGTTYRGVVAKQLAYGMFLNANEFGMYDWGGTTWRGSGYSPNDGNWHFLLCTFQSGVVNGTLCYSDGVLKLTTTITVSNQTVTLQIGEANSSQYFNGSIDEVRVYNRALSATEVANLYRSGSAKMNSSRNNQLTNGLIGLWSFDAQDVNWATGIAYDRSGQGNNGNIANMSTTTSPVVGKLGQGLRFDGVDDYINTTTGTLNGLSNLTISMWIYQKGNDSNPTYGIIGQGDGSTSSFLELDKPGSIVRNRIFFRGSSIQSWTTFANPLELNNWVHVVIVRTTSNIYLYKNGVLFDSTSLVGAAITNAATNNLLIGRVPSGSGGQNVYANGLIDDARIYNRALSASEVKQLYQMGGSKLNSSQNKTGGTLDTGLVGMWSFNGADMNWTTQTAGTAIDSSGNGNNGTLTNMNLKTSPAIGKVNQALKFDGVDDRVSISSPSLTNGATVSVWVKTDTLLGDQEVVSLQRDSFVIRLVGSNTARLWIKVGGVYHQVQYGALISGWNHIVGTYDGETEIIYINGVGTTPNTAPSGNLDSGATNYIGVHENGSVYTFNGLIDEVRIYNRALSATEVKQLYNMGK